MPLRQTPTGSHHHRWARHRRHHRNSPSHALLTLVLADGGCEDFRISPDPVLGGVLTQFLAKCPAGGMQVDDALPSLLFVRLPQANPPDSLRTAAIDAIENEIKILPEGFSRFRIQQ